MGDLYLEVTEVDTDKFTCPLSTEITIFLLKYCHCKSLKVILAKTKSPLGTCVLRFSDIKEYVSLVDSHQRVPPAVTQCILPALVSSDGCLIHSGLCSVLRCIVKLSHQKHPHLEFIQLLGYKEVCLKACAEVSVWTRFCEVELPAVVETILADTGEKLQNTCKVPEELVKLENHFKQPPVVANIGKKKKLLKKGAQSFKSTDGSKKPDEDTEEDPNTCESNAIGSSTQSKPLESALYADPADSFSSISDTQIVLHSYAEGPDMTLTDLILYPLIHHLLKLWTNSLSSLIQHLPRLTQWYCLMEADPSVFSAAVNLGFTALSISNGIYSSAGGQVVTLPEQLEKLYIRDSTKSKKNARVNQSQLQAVISRIQSSMIELKTSQHPAEPDIQLSWQQLPAAVHPSEGDLPLSRTERKCQQLENLASAVRLLVKPGDVVVDFCSGGGHLGILLAYLLPQCQVILIENKEESIMRAQGRVKRLGLENVTIYQCNLDYFIGKFDVGVCLHACGVATDLVLQCCLDNLAKFVICPCCYGAIQNTHTMSYPRSQAFHQVGIEYKDYITVGHAADQTQLNTPKAKQGKSCMLMIDTDRALAAQEHGYEVTLCSLDPLTCSPKNNLLIGKPQDS